MASFFDTIKLGPPDSIFKIKERYNADPDSSKLDCGVGAYRDALGKPYVLSVVKKVEQSIVNDPKVDKEYLSIAGDATFIKYTAEFLFGSNDKGIKSDQICTVQSISGTGALRLGAELL